MKKRVAVIMVLCVLLSTLFSCVDNTQKAPKGKSYFSYFHTETRIYSYAGDSEQDFNANVNMLSNMLYDYHRLFDIYNEYEGMNNLCTLNKNAGGEAIKLDSRLIDFLVYCKDIYDKTSGEVNVMAGAVLSLWHNERQSAETGQAKLPDPIALANAAEHINIHSLILDTSNMTARIIDKDAKIDVGAIGKGYAAEMCAKRLEMFGVNSYVLNLGGNIRIIGAKPDGTGWVTGIVNPFYRNSYAAKINILNTSCVTSGDYERYYTVDGKRYHHIIDIDTLYPAEYYSSVTVITKDSALADSLSTALFCMTYNEGLATLDSLEDTDIEVLWIYKDGTQKSTEGFSALLAE